MSENTNEVGGMIVSSLIIGILERIGIFVLLISLIHLGFGSSFDFIIIGFVFLVSEAFSRFFEAGIEKYISARKPGVIVARIRIWLSTFSYYMLILLLASLIVGFVGYFFIGSIWRTVFFSVAIFASLISRNMIGWVFTRIGLSKVVLGSSIMSVTLGFFMIILGDPSMIDAIIILLGGYLVGYLMLLITAFFSGFISRKYRGDIKLYSKCDLSCYVSSLKYALVLLGLISTYSAGLILSLLILFDVLQRIVLTLHSKMSFYASILHVITLGYAMFLGIPYLAIAMILLLISLFGFGSQSPLRTIMAI